MELKPQGEEQTVLLNINKLNEFQFPSIPNLRIRVECIQQCHLTQIQAIWSQVCSTGDGVSSEEDFDYIVEHAFKENVPGYSNAVLVNSDNEDIIAVLALFPSSLCRSEKPVYYYLFLVVNKVYRGKKLAENIMKFSYSFVDHKGYCGPLARVSVAARSIVPAVNTGAVFIGVIPWCTYLEGRGWFHDLIVHEDDGSKDVGEPNTGDMFPALADKAQLELSHSMFTRPRPAKAPVPIHHKVIGKLRVDFANKMDIWEVQDVLRDCALEGEGFGLDEFTPQGVFNEKHILNCKYWVVRKMQDEGLVACILSGENGHIRSFNKCQAAGAIIVLKEYRRLGLGSELLQYCIDQGQVMGYKYILTDVLACNTAGLALMKKGKFLMTGTIPKSCQVNGQRGYTDCYLHWKQFGLAKM